MLALLMNNQFVNTCSEVCVL